MDALERYGVGPVFGGRVYVDLEGMHDRVEELLACTLART
jgi:hypothetical protein